MPWFAHDLRATKLRKLAPMYFSILWAARGGKKTGMDRYLSPPPRIHECFPNFPSKEIWYFSQPHYELNHHYFFTLFLYVFFLLLASPNPDPFWWRQLLQCMPGDVLRWRICALLWAVWQSEKKKIKRKKSKEQKEKIVTMPGVEPATSNSQEIAWNLSYTPKLPYIWRQTDAKPATSPPVRDRGGSSIQVGREGGSR